MHVVLVNPQIPQNTGNIARLCAGTGVDLHLVGELGFSLEDRYLKRAGLDYWPWVKLHRHDSLDACLEGVPRERVAVYTAHARTGYTDFEPPRDAWLLFGREADGLPDEVRRRWQDRAHRIPHLDTVRSLNLSNAVAVVLYDALRRFDFQMPPR